MIIGLSGLKGSGKSTVARMLCEKYGFMELAFADPLKRGIQQMLGLTESQLYGDLSEKEAKDEYWNVSPRVMMQVIGTNLMRNELPKYLPELQNIWIRRMEKTIQKHLTSTRIVISDCRFLDEACMIRNYNGVVLRICRKGMIAEDLHESEKLAFETDHTIQNSGTLEDLEESVSQLFKLIEYQK
jgi:hypothetical protein